MTQTHWCMMPRRLWQWIHNCLAHPIEGMCQLTIGRTPAWVDLLHEATARRAFAAGDENRVDALFRQTPIGQGEHLEFNVQFDGAKVGQPLKIGPHSLHCWGKTADGRVIDLYICPFEREVDVSRFLIQLKPRTHNNIPLVRP